MTAADYILLSSFLASEIKDNINTHENFIRNAFICAVIIKNTKRETVIKPKKEPLIISGIGAAI
jgi:hypothetical protein